jgi:hypothetical protein
MLATILPQFAPDVSARCAALVTGDIKDTVLQKCHAPAGAGWALALRGVYVF